VVEGDDLRTTSSDVLAADLRAAAAKVRP
jgi:hypothetical protein